MVVGVVVVLNPGVSLYLYALVSLHARQKATLIAEKEPVEEKGGKEE
jgi:hypothetical protein